MLNESTKKLSRRTFLQTAGAASLTISSAARAAAAVAAAQPKLASGAFQPLPLGEVRPAGWLRRQLQIQADGMGGHLDETWADVGPNSGWLGGPGESWERGPYFVDGLLPLAYLLEDARLKAKAHRFIEWTLEHQSPSGMIGPSANNDWWPRMVMAKVLAQYHDATQDTRVLSVLTKYFHYQLEELALRPLRDWGKYRWQDEVLVVEWLYERTHDDTLLRLVALLQRQGYDWNAQFADFRYTGAATRQFLHLEDGAENNPLAMQTHGVNLGQSIKTAAVQFRLTGAVTERAAFFRQIDALDRFHGLPNGMFSCDEHIAGLDPSHGTELCTVVETMFSLEVALAAFGDASIGDRIEKIAYNALPGTFTDDMWAHQYDQQPNQVQCSLNSKPWTTNGPESNLFGLEPHFGCCTANFHQGWPKFTTSLWMRTPEDGLAATLYAPCELSTTVRGTKIHIAEETEYPFRDNIKMTVSTEKNIRFPVKLRIPGWATEATVNLNGAAASQAVTPGAFIAIDREWKSGDVVELRFPMHPRVSRWFHHSIAVERGPLVFSHSPGESWVKLRQRNLTADWQVFPTGAWNYALAIDETTAHQIPVAESAVGAVPFGKADPPVTLQVKARRLNGWRSEDGVALPLPVSPTASDGPVETLTLIPYAAAKLRITAFPQTSATG